MAAAGGLLCVSALAAPVTNTTFSVSAAWDALPAVYAITNYDLYWGPASRTYTNFVGVGTNLAATVSNLSFGVPYYFAVTATDSNSIEGDFSAEIVTNASAAPPAVTNLRIKVIR